MKTNNRNMKNIRNRSTHNLKRSPRHLPVKKLGFERNQLKADIGVRNGKIIINRPIIHNGKAVPATGNMRKKEVGAPMTKTRNRSGTPLINKNKISTARGMNKSGLYSGRVNRGHKRSASQTRRRR